MENKQNDMIETYNLINVFEIWDSKYYSCFDTLFEWLVVRFFFFIYFNIYIV